MDMTDISAGRSPRRELQGPRPTPLKVRKDSSKIRKPPLLPRPFQPQEPPRPPVIIYTVSPKIIHAKPNEFMSLVQRLTGPDSTCYSSVITSSSSSSSSSSAFQVHSDAISPAARFASIEKTKSPEGRKLLRDFDMDMIEGMEISAKFERPSGQFSGILSPNPASLPPIPPNFFSPPSDPNPLGFFHDLSPVLHSNRNYLDCSLLPSPSNFVSSHIPSPNTLDLFNVLFDL